MHNMNYILQIDNSLSIDLLSGYCHVFDILYVPGVNGLKRIANFGDVVTLCSAIYIERQELPYGDVIFLERRHLFSVEELANVSFTVLTYILLNMLLNI